MNFNLIQIKKDRLEELLVNGIISKNAYFELENVLIEQEKLFTICLN